MRTLVGNHIRSGCHSEPVRHISRVQTALDHLSSAAGWVYRGSLLISGMREGPVYKISIRSGLSGFHENSRAYRSAIGTYPSYFIEIDRMVTRGITNENNSSIHSREFVHEVNSFLSIFTMRTIVPETLLVFQTPTTSPSGYLGTQHHPPHRGPYRFSAKGEA